ncbi:MAG: creatininase family protein [Gammaproteobacteria bacterium]|nr:creatininase family protein [Gammaproteobacteria bacterium]
MQLRLSTWPEIEAYLARSTGILVPIGSMEQHGPSGLLGTDAICAAEIARRAGAQADILVGPVIELGAAQFNLDFPETVGMRAATLIHVICDYVRSLASQGFERFFFVNGHGGNVAPGNAAFQDLYAERSYAASRGNHRGVRCRLRSWWEYPQVGALRDRLYGEWEGLHATPSEVAITQHVYPDSRREMSLDKPPSLHDDYYRNFSNDRHYDAEHHRREFPDGRIGSDPSLATPEAGAELLHTVVPEVVADYRNFVAEN